MTETKIHPESLYEYMKAGILRKYDLSSQAREEHDARIAKIRSLPPEERKAAFEEEYRIYAS